MAQTAENIHEQYPLDGAALRLATDGTPTLIGLQCADCGTGFLATSVPNHVGECQRFRTFR